MTSRRGVVSRFSPDQAAMRTVLTTHVAGYQIAAGDAYATGTVQFSLEEALGYTFYTDAFDQFRVMSCVAHFYPQLNSLPYSQDAAGALNFTLSTMAPAIALVPDYDDTTPANATLEGLTYLLQKPGARLHKLIGEEIKMPFIPHVQIEVDTVAGVSVVPSSQRWISTNSHDVVHRGLKYWLSVIPTAATATYPVFGRITAVVEFRGQRLKAPPGVSVPRPLTPAEPVKYLPSALDAVPSNDVEYVMVRRK